MNNFGKSENNNSYLALGINSSAAFDTILFLWKIQPVL